MLTKDAVREWAEAYRNAWVGADSEAAAALFSEDSSYRANIYEEPHIGRPGVAEYWSGVTSIQTEVEVRMGESFVDGQKAIVEFWTTMAIEGDPVTLAGSLILEFDDSGLCRDLREYWNFETGTRQTPQGWGA